MNKTATDNWHQINQQYLVNAIKRVRKFLERRINAAEKFQEIEPASNLDSSLFSSSSLPALESLCQRFKLSPFERDILILCAGIELDSSWASLCAEAQADVQKSYPTFSLALATLPHSNWQALLPSHPLRRWRLIELETEQGVTHSRLRIDERILHYILGFYYLDERLNNLVEQINIDSYLIASHQEVVNQLIQVFSQPFEKAIPLIQLSGNDRLTKKAITSAVCRHFRVNLYSLSVEIFLNTSPQLNLIRILCEREWLLNRSIFLLDCEPSELAESSKENMIIRFLSKILCLFIITTKKQTTGQHQFLHRLAEAQPLLTLEILEPTPQEQREVWQKFLENLEINVNIQIDSLVNHFNLNVPAIQAICWQLKTLNYSVNTSQQLWSLCRWQSRPQMTELAQEIKSSAQWDDLILPETEKNILQSIVTQVRHRIQVYEQWGFNRKSNRGLGISTLFAGASGTGKTLAAEVLGNQLNLDVYRIDLSSVVSKYIGETEKNLRRIFDAAEGSGAILLFDEADALFGKRSEVKDSHDRYANLEVSYLLQRIESYRGLAILTTNLKDSIDQAFVRRIRFIVQFPFPDATQRAAIWRKAFPKQTPTQDLDFQKLAQLNVAGGNIANIAMNAAFLAVEAGKPVLMKYILQATRSEYMKLERPLTDSEIKGWL